MSKEQAKEGAAMLALVAILLALLASALAVLGIWVDARWGQTAIIPGCFAIVIFCNRRRGSLAKGEGNTMSEVRYQPPQWQPMATAPRDGSYILVATGNPVKPCEVVFHGGTGGNGEDMWFNDDVYVKATMWMSLPAIAAIAAAIRSGE